MSLEKFSFRWSDYDANMHIKSTAYGDLFIQNRLNWLQSNGYDLKKFRELGIGPMIIHEHFYYIKEMRSNTEVYMDICLKGNSKDGKYVQLGQYLYNNEGELSCYLDVVLVWLDVKARKITSAPGDMLDRLNELKKTDDYKIIDSSVMRVDGVPYGARIDL